MTSTNWAIDTITIPKAEGFALLSGKDTDGVMWMQFQVDYLALQVDGECDICGDVLDSGWMCMDDGSVEICDKHVYILKR